MPETPLIKFEMNCVSNEPVADSGSLRQLIDFCDAFETQGYAKSYGAMAPEYRKRFGYPDKGSEGNLSYRDGDRFVITGSGVPTKKGMNRRQFARVVTVDFADDSCIISYEGAWPPSSESMMHDAIYRAYPQIGAIFHGHDDVLIQTMDGKRLPRIEGMACTKIKPKPGTRETPDAILEVMGESEFVIIRGHGFLSVGETMEAAMSTYKKFMQRLKESL